MIVSIPSTEMEQQQQGMLIDPEHDSFPIFLSDVDAPIVAAAAAEDCSYPMVESHKVEEMISNLYVSHSENPEEFPSIFSAE